jgi:hypothetical protein
MKKALILMMLLCVSLESTAVAQTSQVTAGLSYLQATQNADGFWGNGGSSTAVLPATMAVLQTMQALQESHTTAYGRALASLQAQSLNTTELSCGKERSL